MSAVVLLTSVLRNLNTHNLSHNIVSVSDEKKSRKTYKDYQLTKTKTNSEATTGSGETRSQDVLENYWFESPTTWKQLWPGLFHPNPTCTLRPSQNSSPQITHFPTLPYLCVQQQNTKQDKIYKISFIRCLQPCSYQCFLLLGNNVNKFKIFVSYRFLGDFCWGGE